MPSVLVTGAARGIGRATALRLAGGGWDVVAGVRRDVDGEGLVATGGERIAPVQLDVTDADQVDASLAGLSAPHRQLYAKHIDGFRKTIPRSQRMASSVDGVAATVERALLARRPRARYVVGAGPRAQGIVAGLLPTGARDALLRAATGVPRRP